MIEKILEKYGFKIYLTIKVLSEDELRTIACIEAPDKFESPEKEPIVTYAASLENSLPLDLLAIDRIVREQLPVGYLFSGKKIKPSLCCA